MGSGERWMVVDGWCWTDDGGLWDFRLILRRFLVIGLAPRPRPRRTRWWLWCLIKAEGGEWCLMDWCFGFFPAGSLCSPARRVDFFWSQLDLVFYNPFLALAELIFCE
ncbi:hypothetical protein Droror1_Dr00015756 [Drosera rotundifolia]